MKRGGSARRNDRPLPPIPERALELLHRVFHDEARGYFPALESCLRDIRAASPDLERDERFERLRELLQTNGRELD